MRILLLQGETDREKGVKHISFSSGETINIDNVKFYDALKNHSRLLELPDRVQVPSFVHKYERDSI